MLPSLPSLPPQVVYSSQPPPSPRTSEFYRLLQAQQVPLVSLPGLPPPPAELPQPSDSSPFRPPSETVSTMKHSAVTTLAEVLEAVATSDLEPEESAPALRRLLVEGI